MRNLLPKLLVLAATSLPITAHADSIDDFTLTDFQGDIISFSLPASPPLFRSSDFYFETLTIGLSFNPPYFGNETLDGWISCS